MLSFKTKKFDKCLQALPEKVQQKAKENYREWKKSPYDKKFHFKEIMLKNNNTAYSVRIGLNYRALGIMQDNTITWFWIGSHEDYNNFF